MWRMFIEIFTSRLGRVLFIVHALVAVFVYRSRTSLAEQPFHFYYESLPLKVLIALDLPGLVAATLILMPMQSLFPRSWLIPWLANGVGIICTSVQWWLIGYLLEKAFAVMKNRSLVRR